MILKRGTTTEQIYLMIKQDIVGGVLRANERLVTEKLATQYSVSRTPVREALKKLEKDGLAEMKSNAGAVVKDIDIDEVSDIYEIRKALEVIALKKAFIRGISLETMEYLKICCKKRKEGASLEIQRENDREFHSAIYRACGSKILYDMMENYMVLLSSFSVTSRIMKERDMERDMLSNIEHERILAAIEKKNQEEAVELLSAHIDSAIQALRRSRKEQAK